MSQREYTRRQDDAALDLLRRNRVVYRTRFLDIFGFTLADDRGLVSRMSQLVDAGASLGLHVAPILARPGWWTGDASPFVALSNLERMAKRHGTERGRKARAYDGVQIAGPAAKLLVARTVGEAEALEELRSQVDQNDPLIALVDDLAARGKTAG